MEFTFTDPYYKFKFKFILLIKLLQSPMEPMYELLDTVSVYLFLNVSVKNWSTQII